MACKVEPELQYKDARQTPIAKCAMNAFQADTAWHDQII